MGRHCYLATEGLGFSSSHSKTKQPKTHRVTRGMITKGKEKALFSSSDLVVDLNHTSKPPESGNTGRL